MSIPISFARPTTATCHSPEALAEVAAAFATYLAPGDCVALSGGLGAGKTCFVRGVVTALHGDDPTSSPTFTLRHRYAGSPPIEHLDLYRIATPDELPELGLDDAFEGDAIVFVEWWEHAPDLLPKRRWTISISGAGEDPRHLTIWPPS